MNPDVTPKSERGKASLKNVLTPLKILLTPLKSLAAPLKNLAGPLKSLAAPLKNLAGPLKSLAAPLKNLPIPKKLRIPVVAGAVLLIVGGAAFGLLHAKPKNAAAPQAKTATSASATSAPVASSTAASTACSGVVRDIYRQTVDEDPSVTLAEVRSEVSSSGINCTPVPEIAAELKDLSPACRDMVQYTFLGVRDGHPDIKVSDIRLKVIPKSVACEHDRGKI